MSKNAWQKAALSTWIIMVMLLLVMPLVIRNHVQKRVDQEKAMAVAEEVEKYYRTEIPPVGEYHGYFLMTNHYGCSGHEVEHLVVLTPDFSNFNARFDEPKFYLLPDSLFDITEKIAPGPGSFVVQGTEIVKIIVAKLD